MPTGAKGSERFESISGSMGGDRGRVKGDLSQLLSFRGRATRMEYFSGNVLLAAILAVLGAFSYGVYSVCGRPLLCAQALSPLFALFWGAAFVIFWANAAQRARRFHDFGAPTALALLSTPLTPLAVFVALTWHDYPSFASPFAPPPSFLGDGQPLKGILLGLTVLLFMAPAFVPATRRGAERYVTPEESEE